MRKFRLSESNAMLASALQSVRTNGRRPEGKSNSGHRSRLKFLFILALLLTVAAQGARADWSVWDGVSTKKPSGYYSKEEGPVLTISSAAELAYVMQNFKRGTSYEFVSPYNYAHVWTSCFEVNCYKLTVDIDMTAGTWIPIGTNYEDLEYYSGLYGGTIFDGDGHTLRIKKDDNSSNNYQGLIKIITKECSVRNLHLDADIHCKSSRLVGGICGVNNGTISNCWVSGYVHSDWTGAGYAKVGGVVGENNGTVEYCCVTATVANYDDNVAGIAGDNDDGTIRHCAFYGSLHLGDDMDNDNIYAGDSGTEEDCFDGFNENQYNTANSAGKTLFCKAIKYTYTINVVNIGPGTVMVSASGEDNVPGARYGESVHVTPTSGTVASYEVRLADGGWAGVTGNVTSGWDFNIHQDVTVNTYFYADWPTQGEGTPESPYIIGSADDWNKFATNVSCGRSYSGSHVKLTNNISVSNPVGSSTTNSFQGTFDGDGHTLTFNKSGWTANFVAPFRYVSGNATIKNLKTAGTIQTTQQFASGLISYICTAGSTVTVQNCASSMTLNSSLDYNSSNGGLIAAIAPNCTVTVSGCAFNGSFAGASSDNNGGIVSWVNDGTTLTITDCLFAPASISTELDGCNTWARGAGVSTLTNSYYTRPYGTAQGTEAIATTAAPRRLGALTKDYGMVKAYENGLQFNGMYYAAPAFIAGSGTEADPYIIGKADDWDTFASFVNSGTKDYSGLYVKLTSDISVTEMVGTDESHAFSGTFLGNGHTITATITGNEKQGTAPFSHINGATIKNLKVAGTITSNQNHAAALVGSSKGTCSIENCTVSATVNGNGYVGGIVGHSTDSNISISNCVFSGLLTGGGNFTGVFIGWGDGGTRSVTNCLYIMQDGQNTNHFDLVKDGGTLTVTNCYKTTDAGTFGVQVYTAVPDNEIYTSMTAVDNKAYYMTCVVSGVDKYYMYTGEAITVTPVVTTADGTVLTANTDYTYTISPEVVKEKGSYTLTITALGSTYIGTKTIAINVVDNLIVTSETTTMTSGRYQVFNDVTIASRITISGDVVLNLSEGTTLNAKKGIELGEGNTLTINGPGTLNIDGCEVGKSAIGARNWGTLVINGGTINAKGGFFGAGLGGDNVTGSGDTQVRCGSITINGGVVNAIGNEAVGIGGNLLAVTGGTVSVTGCDIVINGGQITASGGNIFPGIAPFCTVFKRDVCMVGTLTLGWTNPDDFVSSSSDNGKGVLFSSTFASITFAEGKQFLLEGTETIATAENYIGKKIVPYVVALADNADNSEVLSQYDGKQPSVVLSGRTLYKDGKWNTICLPFDVTLSSSPLDGAVARPLTAASIEGTTLNLTFGDAVTDLVAGTPYIIKWDGGDNIENPLFSGVTIDATDRSYDNEVAGDTRVRFIGTYKSIAFDAVDKSILLMGGASMLYTPAAGASIGAQRAYFKLGDGEALARRITAYNIDFGDSEATGILTTDFTDYTDKAGAWYDMQGRKLDGKPSRAGVYINKGIKVVIK